MNVIVEMIKRKQKRTTIYVLGKDYNFMREDRLADAVLNNFHKKRILVLGDLMVDEYILGKVGRISPEAPVPILNYKGTQRSAGGASNVALNMHVMGGKLAIAGVAGLDDSGIWLRSF